MNYELIDKILFIILILLTIYLSIKAVVFGIIASLYTFLSKRVDIRVGDIIIREEILWNDRQNALLEEIGKGGYDEGGWPPIIDKDFNCLDGNHRISALKQTYGEDYIISVKQSPTTTKQFLMLVCVISNKVRKYQKGLKKINETDN
jgi:hypothetical protein